MGLRGSKPGVPQPQRYSVKDGMKQCRGCEETLSVGRFRPLAQRTLDGRTRYQPRCRECESAYHRLKHRERKYGMTADEFVMAVLEQGGACHLCGRVGDLCVDHDHATGVRRRLLCSNCNSGLGMLQDDPDLLRRAADYLDDFGASDA